LNYYYFCWCSWPFLCLQNGGNSPWEKTSITSLIFILKFQKNWIRYIMMSNIELQSFQINLMLELLELLLIFYSLKPTFLFQNFNLKFLTMLLLFTFFWICTNFPIFSPTRISKLGKFETKKNVRWGGGEGIIGLFKPKISPNLIAFTFRKKIKNVNYILEYIIH
jgi:hypothetical protein